MRRAHLDLDRVGGGHAHALGLDHVDLVQVPVDDVGAAPTARNRPWSSHAALSHMVCTRFRLWVTMMMVAPWLRSRYRWSKQRRWKSSSPTAMTSSMMRMSGSTWTATEKPSRTNMPLE